MPSDTPTDRAALEARARYYEDWAQDIRRHNGTSVDADYAEQTAATLRALASRAEPPADVNTAALVDELRKRAEYMPSDLSSAVYRAAAALTAQAERADAALARAEKAEAMVTELERGRERLEAIDAKQVKPAIDELYVLGWNDALEEARSASGLDRYGHYPRAREAARALAAKLKGEEG